jgi:hypothetical protein
MTNKLTKAQEERFDKKFEPYEWHGGDDFRRADKDIKQHLADLGLINTIRRNNCQRF